MHSMYLACCS